MIQKYVGVWGKVPPYNSGELCEAVGARPPRITTLLLRVAVFLEKTDTTAECGRSAASVGSGSVKKFRRRVMSWNREQ
jgi:hypothetical protein